MNILYMEEPAEGYKVLSCRDVIDYFVMSCVHTLVDEINAMPCSFPSIIGSWYRNTYRVSPNEGMSFNDFWVNERYEQIAIFGAVYYVLARQGRISQHYLDHIEKLVASDAKLKPYFQPFKDAVERFNANSEGAEQHDDDANAMLDGGNADAASTITLHNNVRLEFLLRLMDNDGLQSTVNARSKRAPQKYENYGNDAETARLLNALTGIPLSTCDKYVCNRGLPPARDEERKAVNKQAERLGMKTRI